MGVRRRGRERALQFLFQLGFLDDKGADVFERRVTPFVQSFGVSRETSEFMGWLVKGVLDHLDTIDGMIEVAATNWRIERMNRVDRAIIRMAVFELMKETQTPIRVIINEAIELAKIYSSNESSRFINGILDNIGHRLRPVEFEAAPSAAERRIVHV